MIQLSDLPSCVFTHCDETSHQSLFDVEICLLDLLFQERIVHSANVQLFFCRKEPFSVRSCDARSNYFVDAVYCLFKTGAPSHSLRSLTDTLCCVFGCKLFTQNTAGRLLSMRADASLGSDFVQSISECFQKLVSRSIFDSSSPLNCVFFLVWWNLIFIELIACWQGSEEGV
ncbi:unnamed protein product [Albugo candida]|uniref:Uncharacterized protein n=1 Tax=Albugo candida TaxID=65357 RepID=A0A024GBT9_9STRA|nr:unnamed protein product [Albugo candida]|eukprot:CCI44233.1 unnamed protein product [Albugo candida]